MYELFLWLMVSDSSAAHWEPPIDDDDYEEGAHDRESARLHEKIREACIEAGIAFDLLNLRTTDGGIAVSAGFARNHALAAGTERNFLEYIAMSAPSTYGVIYYQDTEKDGPGGVFNVLKLANHQITESVERLVS